MFRIRIAKRRPPEPKVLVIGSTEPGDGSLSIPWSEIPEQLPSILAFDVVVVVPEAQTREKQARLAAILVEELLLFNLRQRPPRLIWVLNAFADGSVGERIGICRLVPLRSVDGVSIRSFASGVDVVDEVVFGMGELAAGAVRLAELQSDPARIAIPIAAAKQAWILAPPPYRAWIAALANKRRGRVFGVALLFVLALLPVSLWQMRVDAITEYKEHVHEVSHARPRLLILEQLAITTEKYWMGPQANLGNRLLLDQFDNLSAAAKSLRRGDSTARALRTGRVDDLDPLDGFYLSILAGNTAGGVAIAKTADLSWRNRGGWHSAAREVFWRLSVESLHELDFWRARNFAAIFLDLSYEFARGAENRHDDLGPQRTRTMAHIMLRELNTERIYALCRTPGVEDSFARFTDLTSYDPESPSLLARRRDNALAQCPPRPQSFDYTELGQLEEFGFAPQPAFPEICDITARECSYLSLIERIVGDGSSSPSPEVLEEVWLGAIEHCDYLTDDLLWWTLWAMNREKERAAPILSYEKLRDGLLCLRTAYGTDFAPLVALELREVDCSWLELGADLHSTGLSAADPELAQVFMRCRR